LQQLIFLFVPVSRGLSRLASRKDCKPAVRDSQPRLWDLIILDQDNFEDITIANCAAGQSAAQSEFYLPYVV